MATLGDRIKELRSKLGMGQIDFGRSIGVTNASVSRIEKGIIQPRESLLTGICAVHGVSREWLETGQGEMFKKAAGGLDRFSPAQRALLERFSGYFAEKVPIPETEETMEIVQALINILMSENESAKRAIKSSILAVNQTLDSREIESPSPKSNPGSGTKRTKVG